ncbi:MAG: response regulator [Candidatus Didemnitutus sp.]|nr:response regulator [Candidatus Didemnitutus sp.]
MNILIVEDDAVARKLLSKIVTEQFGFTVTVAEDATSAMRQLENPALQIDVAIIDILMPDHDGFWVVQQMKELPYRADTPIALCSASNDVENITRARAAGIRHYILKPYAPETLTAKFRLIIGQPKEGEATTEKPQTVPVHTRLGIDEAQLTEMVAALCLKCRQFQKQLAADYQTIDVGNLSVLMATTGSSAENLGKTELARILQSLSQALHHESTARGKLRSALSGKGLTAALDLLHVQLNEIQGRDPAAVVEDPSPGSRPPVATKSPAATETKPNAASGAKETPAAEPVAVATT